MATWSKAKQRGPMIREALGQEASPAKVKGANWRNWASCKVAKFLYESCAINKSYSRKWSKSKVNRMGVKPMGVPRSESKGSCYDIWEGLHWLEFGLWMHKLFSLWRRKMEALRKSTRMIVREEETTRRKKQQGARRWGGETSFSFVDCISSWSRTSLDWARIGRRSEEDNCHTELVREKKIKGRPLLDRGDVKKCLRGDKG